MKTLRRSQKFHGILYPVLRQRFIDEISAALKRSPVVSILGPRQAGKATLARQLARSGIFPCNEKLNYFDLEDPAHVERLATPQLALAPLHGLVVMDEIQRRPDPFPVLRVLTDRDDLTAGFLILGSADYPPAGKIRVLGLERMASVDVFR